ncbi:hypothetical protein CDD81_1347 [Ophiocordyceps australis]|uniref:Uncharacterized protein n=1 Tax=Ophiocordyceps australis TaxID=1399860 RepID=A0A2C5XTV0_9HYPO|nr:hypothetical protein CDD81_1347 [Ophiocordyceps australis]
MALLPSKPSQVPDWADLAAEEDEDVDEPPEIMLQKPSPHRFQRTTIRQPSAQSSLTRAIQGQSDDEGHEEQGLGLIISQRRRSMNSNVSIASTADLTSDTGLTSPCRTNTPSPPMPELLTLRLTSETASTKPVLPNNTGEAPAALPKKRCIQFACAAKPQPRAAPCTTNPPKVSSPEAPRRPCLKFACLPREQSAHDVLERPTAQRADSAQGPTTPPKSAGFLPLGNSTPRPLQTTRRLSTRSSPGRPKFLRASSKDLSDAASQFHEFASDVAVEEDWIRRGNDSIKDRLTINDTLTMENKIRRLGAEVEEEAALEEEEDAANDEDDEDDELEADEDGNEEDDSDGYHTDEETGFAESDDDEDEDENMMLWTPRHAAATCQESSMVPARKCSMDELLSDSSVATNAGTRIAKAKRVKPQREAVDLPDSTDFVCGTLDEDRPLEEAYLTSLAARRNGKLRLIPQDIDPSFPASDPESDDEEDVYNPVAHDSDSDIWAPGKMEDLHHGEDRSRRRRKGDHVSPRKYRSPAPTRHHSPPPKSRLRSPKPLFGRQSPKRAPSPAPAALTTPKGSPRRGAQICFRLAGHPKTTHTKSLPRPAAFFPQMRKERTAKHFQHVDVHIRGAIDIVKGLERKRQRRREKCYQKYCERARRGQLPERKPQPGRGAERMKELGLLMAGKKDQGNYVLSV